MNNFKKIGMTALAASLVSTSVFAGEMAVTGSASMAMEGHSGGDNLHEATSYSMGNQLTFSGSGELDNGMTVSLSFVIDQNDDANATTSSPFDGHSVSVSSDVLGTLALHGEGGASAASALDTTAAGDMWDNFNSNGGVTVSDSSPGDNSVMYTLPALLDGLAVNLSYNPQLATGTGHADQTLGNGSELGYSFSYTPEMIEGLSVSYGATDLKRHAADTNAIASGEQTAFKASFAYGPVTLAAANSEYDVTGTASDQEISSLKLSYTVSDAISIGYGTEEVKSGTTGDKDAEYEGLSASYTAGGMTVSANMQDGKNISNTTAAAEQVEYWGLGLSFAF